MTHMQKIGYLLGGVAAVSTFAFSPWWLQALVAVPFVLGTGIAIGVSALLAISPIFKDNLLQDPNKPERVGMFVEVQQGRSTVIVKGGQPIYTIEGGSNPPERDEAWYIWYVYQRYVFKLTGLHAYIPFFTKPHTYAVPRYKLDKDGKQGYHLITPNDEGYLSNHVRTEPTTWHFVFTGVDIQKVSFTVRGSALISIMSGKEQDALFNIDSWADLLNQALEGTIRNYMRANVTLDEILGVVSKDLWTPPKKAEHMDEISHEIKNKLLEFTINDASKKASEPKTPRKLIDFGVDVKRIDIRDFDCENQEERAKFTAAAIGREEGRRKSLEGQGTAEAEKKLLEVHDGGEASLAIIEGRAFVDAVKGSDVVTALLGAVAKSKFGGK